MKIYLEQEDGSLVIDGMWLGDRLYRQALEEVEAGEAVIEPYVAPDTRPQEE